MAIGAIDSILGFGLGLLGSRIEDDELKESLVVSLVVRKTDIEPSSLKIYFLKVPINIKKYCSWYRQREGHHLEGSYHVQLIVVLQAEFQYLLQ